MNVKDELDPNVNKKKQENNQKLADNKGDDKQQQQNVNNLPIKSYLDKTVMPLVLQGMAEVAKVRPENPIKYLADYLMQHANDK